MRIFNNKHDHRDFFHCSFRGLGECSIMQIECFGKLFVSFQDSSAIHFELFYESQCGRHLRTLISISFEC